jgi:outer membrane protein OmpA-like peptidoglycan-associated protein
MSKIIYGIFFFFMSATLIFADASIPVKDVDGSKDHPLLKRYEGSIIIAHEHKNYDEFVLPISKLEHVKDRRDDHNNLYFEPKEKKELEGAYTRLVYLIPENHSPLEVLRNYETEIKNKNGKILFECKSEECGGDPKRSSSGGGGSMSLSMYLYPEKRVTAPPFSNAHCAMTSRIVNQRYMASEIPENNMHISILAYLLKNDSYCSAFDGRTIAIIDIIESKDMEHKMVTIKADEMSKQISSHGKIALYGIYFDFNKADIKSESDQALEEIAKLLNSNSDLKLVVAGHTDNAGSFMFNKDLSQRRAEAVVTALISRYGIEENRLMPVGLSFASPVAPNTTEEGRAKNRRVELVAH